MTDEEKKAIEVLQYVKNKTPFIFWYEDKPYNRKETINTILKLIEKQSKEIEDLKFKYQARKDRTKKEIEELKDINKKLEARKYMYNAETGEVTVIPIDNNYISKDKIKAKIEELEIEQESNREDLKIAIDILLFQNIDKIGNRLSINMSVREILQSLLEKE